MLRVLELGGYAAAYCGRLFTQAGADVVRVETETQLPAWASQQAMSMYLHANKRSMQLNNDETILSALAGRADVVVCEAETADALELLGFDTWQAPVKVAITPFGRTGPKRNWRSSSNVIQAMGGYSQLIGEADKAPLSLPGHYVEYQTGTVAYTAANACCLANERNTIDLSMLETLMSLSQFTTVRWHCAGELRGRHGSDFWYVVPSNLFECQDGWVYLNIVPAFWDPLTVFLDRPELLIDERFLDNDLRMQHREVLHELIAELVIGQTKAQLMARAESCRIPLGVVQTFAEVLGDEHLQARQSWQRLPLGDGQSLRIPRLPYRLGATVPADLAPLQINAEVW